MPGDRKFSAFKLFEHFTDSLAETQTNDSAVFGWQKPKAAFCMRLAYYLQLRFTGLFVDLMPNPENRAAPVCDILVHSREEKDYRPLAILCRPSYLNPGEQARLASLALDPDTLALGVAFFPQRDYYLIYRVRPNKVEYYHYDKTRLVCEPLRNKEIETGEGSPQLSLSLGERKRRSKKESDDGL